MSKSAAEDVLAAQLDYYSMPYVREHRFAPPRKWRADFFLQGDGKRLLVEVEGGLWLRGGGRHNRTAGYIADAAKYNAASLMGFILLRFTPDDVNSWHAVEQIRRVLGLDQENGGQTDANTCATIKSPRSLA